VAVINTRIDRLPKWSLRPSAKLVFVAAYFFAFYDIIAIGAVLPDVTAGLGLSSHEQALPLTTSLLGFIIGSVLFGRLADRYGRRSVLAITFIILALSSILCAFAWDVWSLSIFRLLNGMGIGAQIALTATLINELSPAHQRARNIQLNVIAAGCGDAAAPFVAMGLLAVGPIGWRLVLGFGVLAVIPLIMLRRVPESPRWLMDKGRFAEAEQEVDRMESRLRGSGHDLSEIKTGDIEDTEEQTEHVGFRALFSQPLVGRVLVVTLYWLLLYTTTYGFLGYETVLLNKLSLHEPMGLLFTALGDLAFPIGAALPLLLLDRIPRRYLLAGSSLVYALGLLILALSGSATAVVAGAFLVALVILVNSGVGYIYTSEIFPTRVRASALGFADVVGHLGGIFGPYLVLASLLLWGPRGAFGFLAAMMVICAVLIATLGLRVVTHAAPGSERAGMPRDWLLGGRLTDPETWNPSKKE
jgi:putative MFS transporter